MAMWYMSSGVFGYEKAIFDIIWEIWHHLKHQNRLEIQDGRRFIDQIHQKPYSIKYGHVIYGI